MLLFACIVCFELDRSIMGNRRTRTKAHLVGAEALVASAWLEERGMVEDKISVS
uniref:Uncharacterized protein n=1 Tax=Arundo donax TaxID=35708 RepID=A0A0A8ZJP6_ARUDO